MSLRVRSVTVFVSLFCAFSLSANNVFVLPNGTTETNVHVFTGNPLAPAGSYQSGPAPVRSVSAVPDGSRYYTIANTVTDTLVVTDGAFTVQSRSGDWASPGRDGVVTPDGRYFLALAGTLRVFRTLDGAEVASVSTGSSPVSVAVTIDSRYALVLSAISNRLYRIDLTSFTLAGSLSITGASTAVAAGPNGRMYVSTTNAVAVVDPDTLTEVARISLSGTPNRVYFTPDGRYGVATNTQPLTGASAWILDLRSNSMRTRVGTLFGGGLTPLTMAPRVEVVSNERFFMTSTRSKIIYEISIPDGDLDVYEVSGDGMPDAVEGMVMSAEMPEARYLFYIEGQALKRAALATNSLAGPSEVTPIVGTGLIYQGPSSSAPPASAILYNDEQNIAEEGEFRPIIVRALDANGIPVFNASVEFDLPVGAIVTEAMSATNKDGMAKAMVNPGSLTGPIPVDVTIGGTLTVTFDLSVGGGGGGALGGISIIGGQGQLIADQLFIFDPLQVRVTNDDGTPVNNATVTWQVIQGRGRILVETTTTNSDGIAENDFFPPSLDFGTSWEQTVITATHEEQSVTFYATVYPVQQQGGGQAPPPTVDLLAPRQTRDFTGKIGEVQQDAAQAQVVATFGVNVGDGIPNVALEVTTGLEPDEGPWVQCEPDGFALTNDRGVATCDLRFSGRTGVAPATVIVGGTNTIFRGYTVTVLPGDPAVVFPIAGEGQSGNPGQTLPVDLVVEIRDAAGSPLPGASVTWDVLEEGRATLSNVQTTANASGRASARVTLGPSPGTVNIRARSGTGSFTFRITITVTATQLIAISGANQTAVTGQPFSAPLVVELRDASNAPVVGQQVQFAVTAGSAVLGTPSAVTDSQGRASTTVTAGNTPGMVNVQATSGGLPAVNFALNVRLPGPGIVASSFTNGAGGQPGVVPGSVVKIVAPGLAPGVQNCVVPGLVGALPLELAGVTVQFGPDSAPMFAPIYYVCNVNGEESVAVQAPFELAPGSVQAKVTVSGGSTTVENIPVFAIQPGVFETIGSNGLRHAVVTREDGSFVSLENPAARGEICTLYATGLGAIDPTAGTNFAGQGQEILADLVVGVNNAGVRVIGGEYAHGMVGIYVVTFEVPADTEPGPNRPFALAVRTPDGQIIFGNGSAIPIQ